MNPPRAFDIQKAAAEFEILAPELDMILAETAQEFSPDQILYELHVVRRIHQLAQERMGLQAWLERATQRPREYYRAKGFVECETSDGTKVFQASKAQAS